MKADKPSARSSDPELDDVLGQVRYIGPEPAPTEDDIMEMIIEPHDHRWRAYCPALEAQGAATWGYSREEAEASLREVLAMIAAERRPLTN